MKFVHKGFVIANTVWMMMIIIIIIIIITSCMQETTRNRIDARNKCRK